MYYGYEAGFLRIAELRQKAADERRAREIGVSGESRHREESGRSERRARRLWFRVA